MPDAILGAGAFSRGKTDKKTLHPLIHDPGPGVPQHAGLRGEKPPQAPYSRLSRFRPNCDTHSAFLGPTALSTDSRFLPGPPTLGFGFFPLFSTLRDWGFRFSPGPPGHRFLPSSSSPRLRLASASLFLISPTKVSSFFLGWGSRSTQDPTSLSKNQPALRRLKGRLWQPSFAQEERPAHPLTPRTFPGVARTLRPLPSRLRSKTGTVSVLDFVSHRPQGHE